MILQIWRGGENKISILTKQDIKFDQLKLFRGKQPDGTFKWFTGVGYRVTTVEGEEYTRDKQIELTGTQITTAKSFLADIYEQIKSEEGI